MSARHSGERKAAANVDIFIIANVAGSLSIVHRSVVFLSILWFHMCVLDPNPSGYVSFAQILIVADSNLGRLKYIALKYIAAA